MPIFTVYRRFLLSAGMMPAGATLHGYPIDEAMAVSRVRLTPVASVRARDAVHAVRVARDDGHIAPIIGEALDG